VTILELSKSFALKTLAHGRAITDATGKAARNASDTASAANLAIQLIVGKGGSGDEGNQGGEDLKIILIL